MNEWALSWLRAMKAPTPAPAQGAHDRHREQQTRRLASSLADEATTPASLRHTVPPVTGSGTVRLTAGETLADLRAYEFGCAGLCMGDACLTCAALADQISEARLAPDGQRGAREADLTQQINALREGQA